MKFSNWKIITGGLTIFIFFLIPAVTHATSYYVDGGYPYPSASYNVTGTGTATSGTNTIVLDTKLGSEVNGIYNGYGIKIISGTGYGQSLEITNYDAGTNTATVSSNFTANVSGTYQITIGSDINSGTGIGKDNALATIQKAVVLAGNSASHTVTIYPATYKENYNTSTKYLYLNGSGKNITFQSSTGNAADVVITAENTGRVAYQPMTAGETTTFIGVTISGTFQADGASLISIANSNLAFTNCILSNTASAGVGIAATATTALRNITLTNTSVTSNSIGIALEDGATPYTTLTIAGSGSVIHSVGASAVQVKGAQTVTITDGAELKTDSASYFPLYILTNLVTNLNITVGAKITAASTGHAVYAAKNITNARIDSSVITSKQSFLVLTAGNKITDLDVTNNQITGIGTDSVPATSYAVLIDGSTSDNINISGNHFYGYVYGAYINPNVLVPILTMDNNDVDSDGAIWIPGGVTSVSVTNNTITPLMGGAYCCWCRAWY